MVAQIVLSSPLAQHITLTPLGFGFVHPFLISNIIADISSPNKRVYKQLEIFLWQLSSN